jgi:8-oxo-dGTP diphosphatase
MVKPPGIFNVAVEAVVIHKGKILITQRAFDRPHAPGEWEILTGRVDQGETLEEALIREVNEEVKLVVKPLYPFNTFHFYRGPEKAEHLGISFICEYLSGKVELNDHEQINFKWATAQEALTLIKDPSIRSSIKKAEKFISNN